jgi:hypothetical protein
MICFTCNDLLKFDTGTSLFWVDLTSRQIMSASVLNRTLLADIRAWIFQAILDDEVQQATSEPNGYIGKP